MPPKKQQAPSKKTVEKKKEKVIEDKTFGLKNKKGKKQQQFVKQVTNQVKYGGGTSIQKREEMERKEKAKKEEEKRQKAEIDSLLRPTAQQKLSAGADPKSVLCLFYRQGQCKKGDKCKFSHDMSLEGKAEKRSMYVDKRELEEDTIDKWDETKLKEVVQKKHGGKIKQRTDIVCKHFLHAIEKAVYGWFWECPNGDRCIYRHALPPGFVFNKIGAQSNEEEEDTITIEELVDKERQELAASGKPLTQVTLESFKAWKERKMKEKQDKLKASAAKKKEAFVAGRTHGISGREMFEFNPELVVGDEQEEAGDVIMYTHTEEGDREEGDEEEEDKEERGEEGRDITDTAGYSDEILPPPPPPAQSTAQSSVATDSSVSGTVDVGGANEEGDHVTGSDAALIESEEEEVPIDEDLFAAEELDIENLDLEDADIEPDAID